MPQQKKKKLETITLLSSATPLLHAFLYHWSEMLGSGLWVKVKGTKDRLSDPDLSLTFPEQIT